MCLVIAAAGSLVALDRSIVRAQRSAAAALHDDAIVIDGHKHIINRVYWEGIDPWKPQQTGLDDFARSRQGGLDVAIEQVWIDNPYTNYNYSVKQASRLVETFYQVLDANRDKMELALSAADVRRIVGNRKMAVILALEGGFDMDGDVDVLRLFHRLGVRMVQFSNHNTTNAFADAGVGEQKWGGINDHGRAVIREMNRLGIMIDISHASDAAMLQIIEASAAPVVASHHGLRHISNIQRNLSDAVLKALAAKGGVVGIHSSSNFLSQKYEDWTRNRPAAQGPPPARRPDPLVLAPSKDYGQYIAMLDSRNRDNWRRNFARPWRELQQDVLDAGGPLPTVDDWADHVDYAVKLVGDDYIGIGTDMQAGPNMRDFDATSYPRLTEVLVARGYSESRIRKILGGNWMRVLDSAKVTTSGTATRR
jgi:membrane dipeptidase